MQTEREHRNLKILFLADGLAPFVLGGMQQHSTQLVKHMAPLVESITLVHCGELNGKVPTSHEVLAELGNPDNVEVLGLPFTDRGLFPGHYIRASLRVSRSFYEAIGDRLSNYDAVYAQGLMGDAFLDKHPKVMVNLHGLEMFQPSYSWRERLRETIDESCFSPSNSEGMARGISWRAIDRHTCQAGRGFLKKLLKFPMGLSLSGF